MSGDVAIVGARAIFRSKGEHHMLPLSTLKSCRAHELPFGAFGWLTSGTQEKLVVANNADDPFAVVFGETPFVAAMHNLDGDALYTTDWQIEVDPTSAISSNQADSRRGLLMVVKSSVHLPVKFGGESQWSHAALPVPPDFDKNMQRGMAFSRWSVVTWVGDKKHVLFEMTSSAS
jgi:hypothetical protein